MSLIESQAVTINKSDEEIFNFISDFTNFANLMPTQVQDVKITQDSCSFSIQGMPSINLKIYEKIPFSFLPFGKVTEISLLSKYAFSIHCSKIAL